MVSVKASTARLAVCVPQPSATNALQTITDELAQVKKAFAELEADRPSFTPPPVTILAAQRRSNYRIVPQRINPDGKAFEQNVPAGTVVDKSIMHPSLTEFLMVGHKSIQVRLTLSGLKNMQWREHIQMIVLRAPLARSATRSLWTRSTFRLLSLSTLRTTCAIRMASSARRSPFQNRSTPLENWQSVAGTTGKSSSKSASDPS